MGEFREKRERGSRTRSMKGMSSRLIGEQSFYWSVLTESKIEIEKRLEMISKEVSINIKLSVMKCGISLHKSSSKEDRGTMKFKSN
jgi:hypothetical protein